MSTEPNLPDVPSGPVESSPGPWLDGNGNTAVLHHVLAQAGVELGAYDLSTLAWLAGWESSTVLTIASWVHRASAGGPA
ncbi:MAG TPA: hypothetical protein VK698_39625 [Kofleriaceae bacterium]|nr:hypothetical protein [Kofleriaceae bacterium]